MRSKRLTSKSGVTIPKDLRAEVGFVPSMAVDLVPVDGGILVRKHLPTCRFCGSVESVGTVKDLEICPACAAEIKREVEDKYAN